MTFQERANDILEAIEATTKHIGVPLTEREKRDIARRLAPFHGPEVFRIILGLSEGHFFPSGAELEQRVRKAMGKDPAKGLSEEQIEKNRKELIAAGQSPEKAEAGATVARSTLRLRAAQAPSDGSTNPPIYLVPEKIPLPEPFTAEEDPLAGLEDFDNDPLAALDDF